jgi:hypothetical protein
METEHWSLLIAVIALISSVGLPLWFRSQDMKEKVSEKRTLLLQKILSVKSINYNSKIALELLFQRHDDKMEEGQYRALKEILEKTKVHDRKIWELHETCNDYNDGATLEELDEILKNVIVAESEAVDSADVIEQGKNTFE